MQFISLKESESGTYTELLAIQESNSYGDQILMIRKEHQNGHQELIWRDMNCEGSWEPFTKENMLSKI